MPFSPPLIGEDEINEVIDTLRSDWITSGPKVRRFEEEFAASVGAPRAIALSSCTAALHVALATLKIGVGHAVITTPMTFCSTVNVIEHLGARPILVDVEPDTLNINPAEVSKAIEKINRSGELKVKAIIPVHLYGHACDMDSLIDIAAQHSIAIVEDAAHALPAKYKGRKIGSMAENSKNVPILSCFSFYATKNLTTAEGGMLTGTPDLLDEARIWSLHGMNREAWKRYSSEGSWFYEVVRPGFKYNMTDIQASIGLHQLRKLSAMGNRRLEIIEQYNSAFSSMLEFQLPVVRDSVEHAWHLYVLRLNAGWVPRNAFIEELKKRNIGSSVHFIPVHIHPYYRDKYGFSPGDFPVAYGNYQKIVSLPLSPAISDNDVEDVIAAVKDIAEKYKLSAKAMPV